MPEKKGKLFLTLKRLGEADSFCPLVTDKTLVPSFFIKTSHIVFGNMMKIIEIRHMIWGT
mgnify:CR=1 FL=1